MTRWGMIIDLDLCTGCGACEVACKSENNIATVAPDQAEMGRAIIRIGLFESQQAAIEDHRLRVLYE